MKLFTLTLALSLAGCVDKLSDKQKASYIADAESRVKLPPGAGRLQCYRREYAIDYGNSWFKTEKTLIGVYNRVYFPESHFKQNSKSTAIRATGVPSVTWRDTSLSPAFVDQGCDTIYFRYDLKVPPRSVLASCAPTFVGTATLVIEPPVNC